MTGAPTHLPSSLPGSMLGRRVTRSMPVLDPEVPRVWAVADATGDALTLLRPGRFTDLDAGRLGVAARPGVRRTSWLATDIVAAFGCREDVAGAGRPGETPAAVAAAWLISHNVQHLYVQFAWSMSTPALLGAVEIARQAGCHLWLVADTPYTDHHRDVLAPHDPVEVTEVAFLHYFADLTDTTATVEATGRSPQPGSVAPTAPRPAATWPERLPEDDFTTFRASCRDRLTPDEFAVVDAHYRATHAAASEDLVPLLAGRDGESRYDHELRAADWFAQLWQDTASMQQFVVTIRAAQAAAFIAGYFVQVDLDQLLAATTTTPRRAHRTPHTWSLLRLYAHPYRSAPCALVAAGLGVDDIADLTIAAYDSATGVVTGPDGRTYTVEDPAREYVETQVALRRLDGASGTDLLLVNPADNSPLAARTIAANIRTVRREVGTALALPAPERVTPDSTYWTRRLGISIKELT